MTKKENTEKENLSMDEMLPTSEELAGDKNSSHSEDDKLTEPSDSENLSESTNETEQSSAQRMMAVLTDDDEEHVTWSVSSVLGGDFFSALWFKRQIGFFVMIIVMIILYITNRYTSQQAMIKLDNLKRDLTEMRYESMTRSSQLMQRTRESKIIEYLRNTKDSTLCVPTDAPYVIKIASKQE